MNLEIIKEKEYPLLSRKRVSLWCESKSATPARLELLKEVATKLGKPADLIVIKHIYSQMGSFRAKVLVHVYDDKKKMDFFENKSLLAKHEPKKAKKE